MTHSGSPTVRRRRLAAELRRLRGNRTGNEISRAIGWSTTKISRAESGRESLPPAEVEKLIDHYGVTEPLRGRLLELADDAVQRGWWEDYSDVLTPEYREFIGLEEEAVSCLHWVSDAVPGLLQTEDYAKQLYEAYSKVDTSNPPSVYERLLRVRMRRQERLTLAPVLRFDLVMDEAVLRRKVGSSAIMNAQLRHLADAPELPNVDLRVLPLNGGAGLLAGSFVILRFDSQVGPSAALSDVVSTEALVTEISVEGETDTHLYRNFFDALARAALPPAESRHLIMSTIERLWS